MEVEVARTDTALVVAVAGRVDAYTAPELETSIQTALGDSDALVVDLTATDYVSSAGLRVLITLAKRARAGELRMCLCGLQEPVREVFDIAGFTVLFDLAATRDEALARLSEG